MDPTLLLNELDLLPYNARIKRMIEVGKQSKDHPAVEQTLVQLAKGDSHQRALALASCYGSQRADIALVFLDDPSEHIRKRSIFVLSHFGTAEQVQLGFQKVSLKRKQLLAIFLRKQKKVSCIDVFLGSLDPQKDLPCLRLLLPYSSPDSVGRFLSQIEERGDRFFFARLAKYHPQQTAHFFKEKQQPETDRDPRLLYFLKAALPNVCLFAPDAALDLIQQTLVHRSAQEIPLSAWSALLGRRPVETSTLLLAQSDFLPKQIEQVLYRLPLDMLMQVLAHPQFPARLQTAERRLAEAAPKIRQAAESVYHTLAEQGILWWFRRLSSNKRAAVFPMVRSLVQTKEGEVPETLLQLLPATLRHEQARLQLALPTLQSDVGARLPYAALLPWDEAKSIVGEFLNHPDPSTRSIALGTLAKTVRFCRKHMSDLLGMLVQRKNEQDPIREVFFTELAALPPSAFEQEHLAQVELLLQQAFQAADLSYGTSEKIETLVFRLFARFPNFSVSWLVRLAKERGQLSGFSMEHKISDENMEQLAPHLLPLLSAWASREQLQQLATLLAALVCLAPGLPESTCNNSQPCSLHWADAHGYGEPCGSC